MSAINSMEMPRREQAGLDSAAQVPLQAGGRVLALQ